MFAGIHVRHMFVEPNSSVLCSIMLLAASNLVHTALSIVFSSYIMNVPRLYTYTHLQLWCQQFTGTTTISFVSVCLRGKEVVILGFHAVTNMADMYVADQQGKVAPDQLGSYRWVEFLYNLSYTWKAAISAHSWFASPIDDMLWGPTYIAVWNRYRHHCIWHSHIDQSSSYRCSSYALAMNKNAYLA